jgi:hypothetical protein
MTTIRQNLIQFTTNSGSHLVEIQKKIHGILSGKNWKWDPYITSLAKRKQLFSFNLGIWLLNMRKKSSIVS